MSIPAMISVHVEPTHRVVKGGGRDWDGVPELFEVLMRSRSRLEEASSRSVRFNWCLRADPQIEIAYGKADWAFDRYGREIERARAAGDVIGLHVHTWRPVRRFFRDTWIAEFEDPAWVSHCLTMGLEAFRDRMGAPPTIMAFGDSFMHECVLPIMQEHGLRADFSMNPGMAPHKALGKGEHRVGHLPDYRETPRHPFKPSAADFRVPGPSNYSFWEIPVTSGVIGTARDGSETWTKLLLGTNLERVTAITAQALQRPAPYLLAESRTDVLTHPKTRARFLDGLDHLEDLARSRALEFIGIDTLSDRLDSGDWPKAA